MNTSTAVEKVAEALFQIAKEINDLTQELIKLQERIEDATTSSNCARRRES